MIGFCLSWGLTYAWTAKKKKGKVTHQFKKKRMIIANYKIREGKRPCPSLSLSLSTGSPSLFCLLRVCPEGPKEPWTEVLTGTWKKKTLP